MNASDPAGRKLLSQCLAAISMADGELDAREIATMMTVVEQATGVSLSADDIVTATAELEEWEALEALIAGQAKEAEAAFRLQVLKTCILVGRADATMAEPEVERIHLVAKALGFSRTETDEQFRIIR